MVGSSERFRACVQQRENYEAYKALHEEGFFVLKLLVGMKLRAVCAAHVANAYQGAIAALAGAVVAYFTFTLWRATQELAKIADKQVEVARQQMVIAHRPKLRVRNIVLTDGYFAPNKPLKGRFHVTNVGGTKAKIAASHCQFLWNVNDLPMDWPYYGNWGNNPLHPGEIIASVTASFDTGDGTHATYSLFPGLDFIRQTKSRIFFLGWIEYNDDNGTKRRTAFCREFLERDGSARFYPVDDPDYEFEE